MAKLTIPDALKADLPQTKWGKLLVATPVVMTVIATALAGLASSEMTRAQYSRSLAAQQQSKAGDQWGFFQAKRLRSTLQRNTLDLLQNTTEVHPFTTANLDAAIGSGQAQLTEHPFTTANLDAAIGSGQAQLTEHPFTTATDLGEQTLAALLKGELPALPSSPAADANVRMALEAINSSKSETEIAPLIAAVNDTALSEALRAAKDRAQTWDALLQPINQAVERLETQLARQSPDPSARRDFTAARLRFAAARYDAEAQLNHAIANLYEVQVHKSNLAAERHHVRSQRFFYGMLIAQAAVIIATFSLAAQKRSLLWSLAAAAGAAAVSFAIYVFLFI